MTVGVEKEPGQMTIGTLSLELQVHTSVPLCLGRMMWQETNYEVPNRKYDVPDTVERITTSRNDLSNMYSTSKTVMTITV